MSGNARDPSDAADGRAVPHPVLKKYYDSESERRPFVKALFDNAAEHYDFVCDLGSLGSGRYYRRWVLLQSGLRAGMKFLDVATGTGVIAQGATRILREPGAVVGLDPSVGMLRQAKKAIAVPLVQGTVEELPFASDYFDFLCMGYALRHLADLRAAFGEFRRVLRPGGRLLVLEITRPEGSVANAVLKAYLHGVLPALTRLVSSSRDTAELYRYYWDTIEACVPPADILATLADAGFTQPARAVQLGIFSEYTARPA